MLLSDLIKTFESLWPSHTAEEWDRVGLVAGSPNQEIKKVLLSVDVTDEVISDAIRREANLLLSHHPMLLRPVHDLSELTLKGNLVSKAIRANLAIFSAHTNADIAEDGVSESLAKALGLRKLKPLDEESGAGVVGEIAESTLVDFARHVAKVLPSVAQGIKVSGDPARQITRVALVAGAGDSYLANAQKTGVDLFITSDLRHHPAQDFTEQSKLTSGPALMDISHWAAEWIWLDKAAEILTKKHPQIEFLVCDVRTDPWDFAVMQ
jgi:dinuclear metal center YbgI/SA1388 family protein